eukprot:7041364-Pyramimonas_sp.AAC.1
MIDGTVTATFTIERTNLTRTTFSNIWSDAYGDHITHTQLLKYLREQALSTPTTTWSREQFDDAIVGRPDKGR